jgi:hypothetical protein
MATNPGDAMALVRARKRLVLRRYSKLRWIAGAVG